MNLKNFIKSYLLNKYSLIFFGIFLAYISSTNISDLKSSFWYNDEGKFIDLGYILTYGKSYTDTDTSTYSFAELYKFILRVAPDTDFDPTLIGSIREFNYLVYILDLRHFSAYMLFSQITSLYFMFTEDPFLVVFIHKIIINLIFLLFFHKYIIQNLGYKIFIIMYFCFCYLNLYFLRDTLFFIFGLTLLIGLPITNFKSRTNYYFCLFGLACLRPQSIFFYIRIKEMFLLILLVMLTYLFKVNNLNILSLFGNFSDLLSSFDLKPLLVFLLDFFHNILLSVNNINPITKLNFYISHNLYTEIFFLFVASISIVLFITQIFLGFYFKDFYVSKWKNIFFGLIILFTFYTLFKIEIDVRIFIASLAPFYIYFNYNILRFGWIIITLFVLLILQFIKMILL